MNKNIWNRHNQLLIGGGLMLLLSAVLWMIQRQQSESEIRAAVQETIQGDFLESIEATLNESRRVARDYNVKKDLGDDPEVLRMALGTDCRLEAWSTSALLPSSRLIPDLCNFPNRRTFRDRNKIYYYFRSHIPGRTIVTLVPIQVRYRVDNSFLPPYIFLGRFNNKRAVSAHINDFDVHLRQVEGAFKVFDKDGNFVFCVSIDDVSVFTVERRLWVLLIAFGGLILLFLGFFLAVEGKKLRLGKRKVPYMWGFVLLLLLLRAIIFIADLPNAYLPTELFSPVILAVGEYSPSLGDLTLNIMLGLTVVWLVVREYRRQLSRFYKWALRKETIAWTAQCVVLTVCGLSTAWFFALLGDIIKHSTIHFEFSNVFELDGYSYLAFGLVGLVLVGLELVLMELLRFSFHFFKGPGSRYKVLLSLAWLGAISFMLFGPDPALLVSVPLVFGMSLLIFVRTSRSLVFKLDLLNFLLVLFIFSLLTTIGVVKGIALRDQVEMEQIADRQSDEHDLVTESLFERVVQEVEAESFLLDYTSINGLARRLKERFFDSNFKGYDVRVFVYDDTLSLRDKSSDHRPYIQPDSDPPLEKQGRSTKTDDLYMVRYYKGFFESIYIGKFHLLLRSLGDLLVWVELLPTEIQSDRLYPQLLLDDLVRSRAARSDKYEYAVYKEGRLFRKRSVDPFRIYFRSPPALDSLGIMHGTDRRYNNVYYQVSEDKVVHVRGPRKRLFDSANAFSFIFYFFILAAVVLMLPVWLVRFLRKPRQILHLSLKAKLQVFFLSISILPLFVVVFFMSPYIRAHIFADIKQDLQFQTQQIAGQIQEDYLNLRRTDLAYPGIYHRVKDRMRKDLDERLENISKTFFNDINIYFSNGKLHMSTQPSIYALGLTSEYMNPEVYRQIRSGRISDIVIEDKIGNINYFSGFYPIMNEERKIIGILNIPYFKNQDQVEEQSLSLLTLLVNIYVFIFLAIGVIAVLVSNSIIRPLGILSRKLVDTNLGRRNEPIEWETQDEIGEIIIAYNQMLEKLAESEEKLARSERESAWQEMARQVAHEIKNPLTPMRLSLQHLVRTWGVDKPDNLKLNKMFEKVTNTILVQIESLVNIANSFSQFAKMPEQQKTTFRLHEVVEEVAELYSHSDAVQLDLHIDEAEFSVHSDRDQLSRVFNNLVKNAIQAIAHVDGKVVVRLAVNGELATVSVQDNGNGIPEEIANRVFEPRFSTKSSGMGLGLAMVNKIVESSGGRIYFDTQVGKGTTFFVELPRAAG